MRIIDDVTLSNYIKEDLPYFDLTTHLQQATSKRAKLTIFTREDIIVSCSKEAARVAELLGCTVEYVLPSQTQAKSNQSLLVISGDYERVQSAWRLSQLLLEYSSKIATYTREMKNTIEALNPNCELLVTRKHFPFAKEFCIQSILNGGAMPHRLGLGETVLFFAHHRKIYSSDQEFYEKIQTIKAQAVEKKINVETNDYDDAVRLMQYGVDILQLDKISPELFLQIAHFRDTNAPHVKLLATGGIDKTNVAGFVKAGADAIVTSKIYFCGMADMGSSLEILP